MKIFFLLNPSRNKNRWDDREAAAQTAKRYGWTPRFGEVDRTQPGSTQRLIDQALEEGCSRIVSVAGDGTLHRLINSLARTNRLKGTDIAIVPAGTCNDFARWLGLKRKEEALRIACSGKARPVDLGSMDGELFVNNAGLGRRPDPAGKRLSPLQTLRRFAPNPLHVEWDKGSIEGVFFMLLACNAPYFSKGLHFTRNARLDDGLLDIFLIPVMSKWQLASMLAWARLGRPAGFRRFVTLKVPRLEVTSTAELWPQADGETPAKALRRVTFAIAPEKAMIVAP